MKKSLVLVMIFCSQTMNVGAAAVNNQGILQRSFGAAGVRSYAALAGVTGISATCLGVQSNGQMIIGGYGTASGGGVQMMAIRINPNGNVDYSFGGSGQVLLTVPSPVAGTKTFSQVTCNALVVQPDNKIVMVGLNSFTIGGTTYYYAVVSRLTADGAMDTTFGTGGNVSFGFDVVFTGVNGNALYGVALTNDGTIVVVGDYNNGAASYYGIATINTTGSTVTRTYIATHLIPSTGDNDYARAVAIQSDGKIVVGGYSHDGTGNFFTMARYMLVSGSLQLDTTFGYSNSGMQYLYPSILGGNDDQAFALQLVEGNGSASLNGIILGGTTRNGSAKYRFGLAMFDSNGRGLSTSTFNGNTVSRAGTSALQYGIAATAPNSAGTPDRINAMTLDSNGRIIACGTSMNSGNTNAYFALARFLSNGALDSTFGNGGTQYVSSNIGGGTSDTITGVQLQSIIYVAGTSNSLMAAASFVGGAAGGETNLFANLIRNQIASVIKQSASDVANAAGAAVTLGSSNEATLYSNFKNTFNDAIGGGSPVSSAATLAYGHTFDGPEYELAATLFFGSAAEMASGNMSKQTRGFFTSALKTALIPSVVYACALYVEAYAKAISQTIITGL